MNLEIIKILYDEIQQCSKIKRNKKTYARLVDDLIDELWEHIPIVGMSKWGVLFPTDTDYSKLCTLATYLGTSLYYVDFFNDNRTFILLPFTFNGIQSKMKIMGKVWFYDNDWEKLLQNIKNRPSKPYHSSSYEGIDYDNYLNDLEELSAEKKFVEYLKENPDHSSSDEEYQRLYDDYMDALNLSIKSMCDAQVCKCCKKK